VADQRQEKGFPLFDTAHTIHTRPHDSRHLRSSEPSTPTHAAGHPGPVGERGRSAIRAYGCRRRPARETVRAGQRCHRRRRV